VFDPCATLLYLARSFTEFERLGPTLVFETFCAVAA